MDRKKVAEALRQISAGVNALADIIAEEEPAPPKKEKAKTKPAEKKEPEPAAEKKEEAPASTEETAPDIKFDELRGFLAGLASIGKKDEVKALIQEHGFTRLSDIEQHPELYAAIYKEAEAIKDA